MSKLRAIIVSAFCLGLLWLNGSEPSSAQGTKGKKKVSQPSATPIELIKAKKDFKVEQVYSVPRQTQGSWVNMTVDPKGRLITSDQYGKLYRITPPKLGASADDTKVEELPVELGEAHGLLWAHDSLYVVVNEGRKFKPRGLWRVTSSKNDDVLDKKELLKEINGSGRAWAARRRTWPRRQVALRAARQPYEADPGRSHHRPADLGRRLSGATLVGRQRPRGRHHRAGRVHLQDRSRRQIVGAHLDGLSQPIRHGLQPRRRTLYLRCRHGMGHEPCPGTARLAFATPSPAASSAGAAAQARCTNTCPTTSPPSSTSAPAVPPA